MRLSLILVLAAAACGGGASATKHDLAAPVDLAAPAEDRPFIEQPCVTKSDCDVASVCAYPLADGCAATGHCMPSQSPGCGAIMELCGCDGKTVQGGTCLYPDGYAGGPTTGKPAGSCNGDGGT